jgi:hypothetical protein
MGILHLVIHRQARELTHSGVIPPRQARDFEADAIDHADWSLKVLAKQEWCFSMVE